MSFVRAIRFTYLVLNYFEVNFIIVHCLALITRQFFSYSIYYITAVFDCHEIFYSCISTFNIKLSKLYTFVHNFSTYLPKANIRYFKPMIIFWNMYVHLSKYV